MPFELDQNTALMKPSALNEKLKESGDLFPGKFQFDIKVCLHGDDEHDTGDVEHWIWQFVSCSC